MVYFYDITKTSLYPKAAVTQTKKKLKKKYEPDIFESHISIKNITIYPFCSRKTIGYFCVNAP